MSKIVNNRPKVFLCVNVVIASSFLAGFLLWVQKRVTLKFNSKYWLFDMGEKLTALGKVFFGYLKQYETFSLTAYGRKCLLPFFASDFTLLKNSCIKLW